jgi:hypothetical protein
MTTATRAIITSTFTTTRNTSSPLSPQLPELELPFLALVFNATFAQVKAGTNSNGGAQPLTCATVDNAGYLPSPSRPSTRM